jgi:hypothetical protein
MLVVQFLVKVFSMPVRYLPSYRCLSYLNNFRGYCPTSPNCRRHGCMNIGSVGSTGLGFSSRNMKISNPGSSANSADTDSGATVARPSASGGLNKTSSSSSIALTSASTTSSASTDYSSMTTADLKLLVWQGDTHAQKELDQRTSRGQNGMILPRLS